MQIDWVDSDWASVDKNEAQNYLNFCKKAASEDSIFNSFRSNKLYGRVLEGGEYEIGLRSIKYLKKIGGFSWLENNFPEILNNDLFGLPLIHSYENDIICSSSTLQYSYDVFNCKLLLGNDNAKKINIVEVGGGFGGFARLASSLLNVEKYYLIDQTEPLALAKKYLDNFPGISQKIIYVDAKEVYSVYKDIKKIDLFVASASVSELSLQLQDFYINNFIKRSTYSYIIYSSTHFRGASKFIEEKLNLLDKEFKVKVDNPYEKVLYIYLSKNLIADEVIGKNNDQFWKFYNSFYYNFIRFSRSLKEKLKRKILFK